MKLSSSALFTLSSSLGIVASVQPPPYGYGDPYCPHDSCLQVTNTGLRGARSTLYNCYDQSTGKSISPWTGSNTDVPPEGWNVPSNCDDTVDAANETMSSANQQKFADALTSSLYSEPNECSSALSVSMVFSLLYPGATNDGIIDMRDTFGYPDSSNMQLVWENASERMTERANGACISWSWNGDGTCVERRSQLKFANSVWLDKSDELNDAYVHVVGDYAMQANFNSPSSATAVNSWVKNATNGLIDGIVPEGEPLYPTKLLAANSIYLESRWGGIEPFDSMNTNLDTFYASPSRSTKVSMAHFMNTVKEFDYSHEALAGYQTIKLPLQDNMSMIFVLPQTDGAKAVKSTALIAALDGLEYTKVALALPKFNFQYLLVFSELFGGKGARQTPKDFSLK